MVRDTAPALFQDGKEMQRCISSLGKSDLVSSFQDQLSIFTSSKKTYYWETDES